MTTRDLNYKAQYSIQQQALREICYDLGLKIFYPDYHQKRGDKNTVLLYLKEDFDYNADLDKQEKKLGYLPGEYKQAVCYLENTDCNGRLDMKFMNHGRLDLRGLDWKDKLREYIEASTRVTELCRKENL